jgi:hypothetical protein
MNQMNCFYKNNNFDSWLIGPNGEILDERRDPMVVWTCAPHDFRLASGCRMGL